MHLRPSVILPWAPPSLRDPESPKSQDKPWPCSGPLYCTDLSTDRLHVVHAPLASQMVPHTIWVHWVPSSAVLQAPFIPRPPFASHGHALGPSKALNPPSQNVVHAPLGFSVGAQSHQVPCVLQILSSPGPRVSCPVIYQECCHGNHYG